MLQYQHTVRLGKLAFIGRFIRVFRPRRESDRVSSTSRSRYVRITANFCSFHATAEHGNGAPRKIASMPPR